MKQKKSIWIKLFYGIAIFLLLTWTFSLNLYMDESFSLKLSSQNWLNIIKLDSLDVHPPLYYLILKAFFIITTFGTSSMIIKAILGRIFSVICFAIMSKGIQLIFKKSLNKNINFKIIFLGLLLLPNVLYHATCIRMYAFGAMLITWELVFLIDYLQHNKLIYLFYALIFAILSAYTHYFAAVIAGLIFLYEFISSIKHSNKRKAIQFGITGIILFILFIPWMTIAFKQVSNITHSYWMTNNINFYVDLFYYHAFPLKVFYLIGFVLQLIFTFYCYKNGSSNFKKIYRRVLFYFFGTMLLGIIINLFIRPIFQSRYLFFIFPLYLCLTVYEIILLIKINNKFFKRLCVITFLFLSLGLLKNTLKGFYNIKRDFDYCHYINLYNKKTTKNITLHVDKNNLSSTISYSIYLPNKNIVSGNEKKLINTIQTGHYTTNKKLFNTLYPNFKFINTK